MPGVSARQARRLVRAYWEVATGQAATLVQGEATGFEQWTQRIILEYSQAGREVSGPPIVLLLPLFCYQWQLVYLLLKLFDLVPTGAGLYAPVFNECGEVVDFQFVRLNPAAQRPLGLPAQPTSTAYFASSTRTASPRAFLPNAARRN